MTTKARDLVEARARYSLECGTDGLWEIASHFERRAYFNDSRAALIATFRKLAEDGPTEAMLVALNQAGFGKSGLIVAMKALVREMEGLTP